MQGTTQPPGHAQTPVPQIIRTKEYYIVDARAGRPIDGVIEQLSSSGGRVLRDMRKQDMAVQVGDTMEQYKHRLSAQDVFTGLQEGRYKILSREELIASIDKSNTGAGITGGGDCAGIADFLAALKQHLKPGLAMVGVRDAGKGLMTAPADFDKTLIPVSPLLAEDWVGQSSTPLGSSREDPLKKNRDNTVANIRPFYFFYGTGGNDHLGLLEKIAREFPKKVVVGTFKSVDGDGCLLVQLLSLHEKGGVEFKQHPTALKERLGFDVGNVESSRRLEDQGERRRWMVTTDKNKTLFIHVEGEEVTVFQGTEDGGSVIKRLIGRRDEKGEEKLNVYAEAYCQMLGFNTAVRVYQNEILNVLQNADTHKQWHVCETFGRGVGNLAYEAARILPPNFNELSYEEQRKIVAYHRAIMILVPERPTTLRSIAAEAKGRVNSEGGKVLVVAAEGFMPPELKYEMDRLAKNEDLKRKWISRELTVEKIPELIESLGEDDPRADLRKILMDRELAAQFGKTVWESKLDPHGNVEKLSGIRKFLMQALEKLAGAPKVNEILVNYEARGAAPTKYDSVMGQKVGGKAAVVVNEGVTGGKAVVYFEGMDPRYENPFVVDLVGVSAKNNLNRFPDEELIKNGVFWVREDLSKYLVNQAA